MDHPLNELKEFGRVFPPACGEGSSGKAYRNVIRLCFLQDD